MNFQDTNINEEDNISEEQEDVISEIEELDEETKKIAFSKSSNISFDISTTPKKEKKTRKKNKDKENTLDINLTVKRDINKFNPRPLPSDWNGEISVEEYNKKHHKIETPVVKQSFPSLGGVKINKSLVNKLWGKMNLSE